jgi:hypothetical protein
MYTPLTGVVEQVSTDHMQRRVNPRYTALSPKPTLSSPIALID